MSNGSIYINLEEASLSMLALSQIKDEALLSENDKTIVNELIKKLFTHARRLKEVKDGRDN